MDKAGDRLRALQCPIKNTVPNLGTKCGRRERESRHEGRRERSLRDRNSFVSVTVKVIPVFRKAALFAGCRWNEDLGRSVHSGGYPPARGTAPMTADVRRLPRRGTSSACATTRTHSSNARTACLRGCVLHSVLRPVRVDPHYAPWRELRWWGGRSVSRLGKPTKVGLTFTGVERTDGARLAACHSLPQGRGRDTSRKGRRSRSPSLRGSRVRVRLLARR